MTLSALVIFFVAEFVFAVTPGPSVAALVTRVISRGWRSVLPFLAAMWLGEIIWLTCAVAGLSYIAQTFHWAFVVLKYLGAAYLFYLAYKMWTARADEKEAVLPKSEKPARMFFTGLAVTLGNPKLMIFYVAFLPSIIDLAVVSPFIWLELTLTLGLALIAGDFIWVFLASQARRWLKSPRAGKLANRISATIMGGAATAIAAE
ncbi:MAG TPA: LysE family translocator [Aestuariivirga sp.]